MWISKQFLSEFEVLKKHWNLNLNFKAIFSSLAKKLKPFKVNIFINALTKADNLTDFGRADIAEVKMS